HTSRTSSIESNSADWKARKLATPSRPADPTGPVGSDRRARSTASAYLVRLPRSRVDSQAPLRADAPEPRGSASTIVIAQDGAGRADRGAVADVLGLDDRDLPVRVRPAGAVGRPQAGQSAADDDEILLLGRQWGRGERLGRRGCQPV